jgi:hypothetical protein
LIPIAEKESIVIYAKNRILDELSSTTGQLASLAADLESCRAVLQAKLGKPPPFMSLSAHYGHFADAFTHLERAKAAIRALHPICHQADFLRKRAEKKGRRR